MARTRIYDLTEHTTPADDDFLIIDRSGWTAARKVNAAKAIPLRYVGSGWSLKGGGNNRGTNAVDLQQARTADTQVASGNYTTIGGGNNNTASVQYATIGGGRGNTASAGYATVCGGRSNTASGPYATVLGGRYAIADKSGQLAHAGFYFTAIGDAQHSIIPVGATTTDATPTVLDLERWGTPGEGADLTIADDTVWNFRAEIVAMTADAAKYAAYTVTGLIKRANGTVAVAGVTTTVINESDAGWDATAEADDTNKALSIKVTGAAGTTIRWVAAVYTTECSFGS